MHIHVQYTLCVNLVLETRNLNDDYKGCWHTPWEILFYCHLIFSSKLVLIIGSLFGPTKGKKKIVCLNVTELIAREIGFNEHVKKYCMSFQF